jgi:hypothetical protein
MANSDRLKPFMHRLRPGVPKRYLLLVAALVWTVGGVVLGIKGLVWLAANESFFTIRVAIAFVLGLAFFELVFARVSLKHITRIHAIDLVRPSLFAFFDLRGYVMMALMISLGVFLRKSNLVNPEFLYNFYVLMGTPLLVSALRFYYAFWRYPRLLGGLAPASDQAPRPS